MLRRYFSMILTEESPMLYGRNKLVTVTNVKMTPDLLIAKIYISVLGAEDKMPVIKALEAHYSRLRQTLAHKIGGQMRRMPDLEFFLDETIDEMYRVQNLLDQIKNPAEDKKES